MISRLFAAWLCAAALWGSAVPAPREYLGFTPGDDYKLAAYAQIAGYFQKLAQASDRIRVIPYGSSSLGKPLYVAFISAPENLRRIERYREISRRLALGEPAQAEAEALAGEGKAVVWIDSGLHATEVAPAQHSPELAWRLVTGETAEIQRIRQSVILVQVPVINPDGLDWVVEWYRSNVGTPYESAPLPRLYQKYAGHDNNRDWFMLNLDETRHASRLLFREWFPQIVYNQHQAPPFPARIFVPPYAEPLNPNIPAPVMEGITLIGAAIKERFAREDKPGVLSYFGFDAWWNGGLRSVPAFHNMHGILTETALNSYATPRVYDPTQFPASFANGVSTREPSIFYERPWNGGKWGTRDAIEYMLTADFAILSHAAERRADYLLKSYQMARAGIAAGERGSPYAYLVPPEQWDRSAAPEMLERLSLAGVKIERARAPFRAAGREFPEGTYVLPAAQPFRAYLVDLMEPQKYPVLRSGAAGPQKPPYDIAGWTLPLQMGIATVRVDERFTADLVPAAEFPVNGTVLGAGQVLTLDHRESGTFLATAFLLDRNEGVRWAADGTILIRSDYAQGPARFENFARHFGVTVTLQPEEPAKPAFELRRPRVAIYQPWMANADSGWTEWVLDRFKVPYSVVHNEDLRRADLRTRFDSLILAAQGVDSILHGVRHGETSGTRDGGSVTVQRPEYAGGIEVAGLGQVQQFVAEGGTLIALDTATDLPIEFFPLPYRNVVRPGGDFQSPGSLIRVTVDTTHPLAFGMPKETVVFSTGGEAFETTLASGYDTSGREARSVIQFARSNLLASGWLAGTQVIQGKTALAEARYGLGRVVLFGFRPQFRGQSWANFRLLLNAVYLGSAQRL